jgi:DNA-binding NarL/FixJ family response regulator
MAPLRILIADDHGIVRRGVRALLESQSGWRVCGEAATGAEAVCKARQLKPDVIVMDITMPELSGWEATRQIRAQVPGATVLILSMHETGQAVREVLKAGAQGYVLKSDLDRNLIAAVRALGHGERFFSQKVSEIVIEDYLSPESVRREADGQLLTARQRDVVRLLAEGKTNKEVATELGISVKTAEAHRTNVMQRLKLRSFSDLVRYAVRQGIVNG